jgi:hypothetical protein
VVITQFSFYVVGHAETLRSRFVAHTDKKVLDLGKIANTFETLEVNKMARMFTAAMEEHLIDNEIRDWIIPDFNTTTDNDIAIASMAMMATMKK